MFFRQCLPSVVALRGAHMCRTIGGAETNRWRRMFPRGPSSFAATPTLFTASQRLTSASPSPQNSRLQHVPPDGDAKHQYVFVGDLRLKIRSYEDAQRLLSHLTHHERACLIKALRQDDRFNVDDAELEATTAKPPTDTHIITREQMKMMFLINFFPFVGFGFLDNFVMITAGEYIDVTFGIVFNISTMAAAAWGNIISDIAGIGLAHHVESAVQRVGIHAPSLTTEQFESRRCRTAINLGRCSGLVIGCIVGMFPLLFFDETKRQATKLEEMMQSTVPEAGG